MSAACAGAYSVIIVDEDRRVSHGATMSACLWCQELWPNVGWSVCRCIFKLLLFLVCCMFLLPAAFVGSPLFVSFCDQTIVFVGMAAATYTPAATQCCVVLLPEAVIPCVHCSCICHEVSRWIACFESFIIWPGVGRRCTCQWVVDLATGVTSSWLQKTSRCWPRVALPFAVSPSYTWYIVYLL